MSKSCTRCESCVQKLSYKKLIGKIMGKSYAHHKTCAKKLSSDIYAGKYDLIVIWKKLYIHKL